MTAKGYVNDFYKQFEELNKKLDKANNTIFSMSLTISELSENNKSLAKELEKANKKVQELLLEIERLKKITITKIVVILVSHPLRMDIKKSLQIIVRNQPKNLVENLDTRVKL